MRVSAVDELIDEFAPPDDDSGRSGKTWVGRRDLDVGRFFVAWSPGQLEGILRKPREETGAYVAYLGEVNEKMRDILSIALGSAVGFLVRFVSTSWRYYSWGASHRIARDLAVTEPVPVRVKGRERNHKVMTFLPPKELPKVRESLFAAGAGRYGLYSKCSFSHPGRGTFYGEKGSKPSVGEPGKMEIVEEEKLEVKVPQEKLARVISVLRGVHPYEEPVIEVYDTSAGDEYGEGRTGSMSNPLSAKEASRRIASVLGSQPSFMHGETESGDVIVWDGDAREGLHEAALSGTGLYVGPDSGGLGKILSRSSSLGIVEFPRYCFLMAGSKELVYMVREMSKKESWGIKTFLPTRSGRKEVHR